MPSPAVVDTGPLLAALDRRDPDHHRCAALLRRPDLHLVIPALVVAEVAFLAETRLGPAAEAAFVRGLADLEVEAPAAEDWPVIAAMVERYGDLRIGTTDASVVVLADRLETDLVLTLDRRHFEVIRSPAGRAFRLLPESRPSLHEEPAKYPAGGG